MKLTRAGAICVIIGAASNALADAPLIVDGFSQGSNLTLCNLVAKVPERAIAFGAFGYVNPEWPVSKASRKVPGVLHCGEKDQHCSRYKQVFAANRPNGAPWSLTLVPGLGRSHGQYQHLALPFYLAMIERRLPEKPAAATQTSPTSHDGKP